MATIQELLHSLGNRHNLVTVGCGATKEIAEECLREENISKGLKDKLTEILKNLQYVIKETIEADRITTEIRDRVYKISHPDTERLKP